MRRGRPHQRPVRRDLAGEKLHVGPALRGLVAVLLQPDPALLAQHLTDAVKPALAQFAERCADVEFSKEALAASGLSLVELRPLLEDEAEALHAGVDRLANQIKAGGEVEIGSGEGISMRDLATLVADVTDDDQRPGAELLGFLGDLVAGRAIARPVEDDVEAVLGQVGRPVVEFDGDLAAEALWLGRALVELMGDLGLPGSVVENHHGATAAQLLLDEHGRRPLARPRLRGEVEFRVLLWGVERLVTGLAAHGADHKIGQRLHATLVAHRAQRLHRGRFDGAIGVVAPSGAWPVDQPVRQTSPRASTVWAWP